MKTTRLTGGRIGAVASLLALVLANPVGAQNTPYDIELADIKSRVSLPYLSFPGVMGEWTEFGVHGATANTSKRPLIIVLQGDVSNPRVALTSIGFNREEFEVVGLKPRNATPASYECRPARILPDQKCYSFFGFGAKDDAELDREVNWAGDAILSFINKYSNSGYFDPKRIYVFGESGGGFTLLRNLCKLAGKVAAVGVSAALPRKDDTVKWNTAGECNSGVKIPYIHVHGTKDDAVPWNGKAMHLAVQAGWGRYEYPNVSEVLEAMAIRNGANSLATRWLPNPSVQDGSWVFSLTRSANGLPVVRHLLVWDGGHMLPNALHEYPIFQKLMISETKQNLGNTNLDIVAANEIARFFLLHRLQ